VEAGETVRVPPLVTVPMPLSIEMLVALATLQLSVDDCPEVMVVGEAVKFVMVGAGAVVTVTIVEAVTDPEELLAVNV